MSTVSSPRHADHPWRTVRLEALNKVDRMPSLNSVVLEFLELSQREFFTARDFEKVISKDQALVARLLKLANSGLYGRSRSIHSIPEAIVLIGLESLKKIVFAVSTEGLTKNNLTHYTYHRDQGFWLHSLGVAQASRVLAEMSTACTLRNDEIYVAGLLHDVGKLVIDEFLSVSGGKRVTREMEIDAVGMDHSELAEYILRQWGLPESITACVRHHHDFQAAGEWAGGAAVMNLAEGICGHWGLGRRNPVDLSEDLPRENFVVIMDHLGLPTGKWDQVIWDIRQSLVNLDGVFKSYDD